MAPTATGSATIRVGTASWTDKTLIACGRFYPKEANSAEARLRYYASRFPVVEVDSSYYAMPAPATAQLWAERTPADFTFNVKAFRLFTGHPTTAAVMHRDLQPALAAFGTRRFYYKDLPADLRDELWRRFQEALEPLQRAGKLGAVHFQFAPWLLRNRDGHEHVRHCVEAMSGWLLGVEFRHRSWFADAHAIGSTLDFERELGVVHTVVDAPQGYANSVPMVWAVTHPRLAILRLHGRNARTWNLAGARSASDRFDYDYPDDELRELVPPLRELAAQVERAQVIFNNNQGDQGQRNATRLIELLAAAGV